MPSRFSIAGGALIMVLCAAPAALAAAVGAGFTYQGELLDGGAPVTGDCDFEFTLWDDPAAGVAVGSVVADTIELTDGKFTTVLDFGAGALSGDARWLEIDVCCPSPCSPTFTTLSPRQELTPSPHAVRAVDGVGPPDALEVDAVNGRIGIGTSAPIQPLHVVGTIMAENPGSSPLGSTVRLGAPSADPGLAIQRGDGAGGVAQQWDIAVEFNDTLEIRDFTAGGAERLVIDDAGRVGVGTNAPAERLDVVGNVHASGTIASGDSITIDGTSYTITSDADLEVHVAEGRIMRYESNAVAPNVVGGHFDNVATPGVRGATIAGGGWTDDGAAPLEYNRVTDDYGTIGGGQGNQAGDAAGSTTDKQGATVGGGRNNTAGGQVATVAGGEANSAVGYSATVGGGSGNGASGNNATVCGGTGNTATGSASAIPGGGLNTATGSTSFAAGYRAKSFDAGTFVWADSTNADFTSTGPNQFLVRANNGVGINTNTPAEALDVSGNIHASGTIASGNSIAIDGTAYTITSDADLDVLVADGRVMRYESDSTAPNIIGGYSANTITAGVKGATIAGGGRTDDGLGGPDNNRVTDDYGTIGGGQGNRVGDDAGSVTGRTHATVSGGIGNTASGWRAVVGGGLNNMASGTDATVGGGSNNVASGAQAAICGGFSNTAGSASSFIGGGGLNATSDTYSTLGGGFSNTASGHRSTIMGGSNNIAGGTDSTVGGGNTNIATGSGSTVPGGIACQAGGDYSLAAGRNAKVRDAATVGDADGDQGTFVWADSVAFDFVSTGSNQFLIRAAGGVGINTNDPDVELEIANGTELTLSDNSGWMMVGDQDSANLAFDTNEVQARSDGSAAALALNPAGGDVNIAASGALTLVNGTLRVGTDTLYADPSTEFVGLNTTSPTERLHVVGNIVYTGTITDISDERLKSDIAPVEDARAKLRRLRGVYFTMNDTPDQRDVGLIAQDVQAVLPEAVRIVDREHGHLGVSYPSVIPLLVEAVKDQDELIDERDRRIVELERHNTSMESRLERMEQVIRALEARMEGGAE